MYSVSKMEMVCRSACLMPQNLPSCKAFSNFTSPAGVEEVYSSAGQGALLQVVYIWLLTVLRVNHLRSQHITFIVLVCQNDGWPPDFSVIVKKNSVNNGKYSDEANLPTPTFLDTEEKP